MHALKNSTLAGRLVVALVALVATSGCYRMTIYNPVEQPDTSDEKFLVDLNDNAKWHHSVLFGLIDLGSVEVDEICPEGVANVHMRMSFLNALATFATWTMYVPMTVQARCVTTASADEEMMEEEGAVEMEGEGEDAPAAEEESAPADDEAPAEEDSAPAEEDAAPAADEDASEG